MTTITVIIAIPPREIRPNYHPQTNGQRHKRRKMQMEQKREAYYSALATHGSYPRPIRTRARVTPVVYRTSGRSGIMDEDNLHASLKYAIDGITLAGIWHDDSAVRWADTIWRVDKANPRVELVIRKEEAEDPA